MMEANYENNNLIVTNIFFVCGPCERTGLGGIDS